MNNLLDKISSQIDDAENIVIIQADNPDGDSLASSLALESMFSEMNKNVNLYCGVDVPSYLRYLPGWDRVSNTLPTRFDLSIIVDTSSLLLLEALDKSDEIKWLKSKPCIIIDHHISESTINFATLYCDAKAVATGEIIYEIAKHNNWPTPLDSLEFIATSILSDSLGLMSEGTSPRSIEIISEIVSSGVSLAKLDNERKLHQKKQPELLKYKGKLLERIEYSENGQIAIISIPWEEIEKYSPLYNPSMLVIDEMRQVENVKLAVAFKSYPDKRITAKVRANFGYSVANKIAEEFGGGGHPYASGFRVTDGSDLDTVKSKFIELANKYLSEIDS